MKGSKTQDSKWPPNWEFYGAEKTKVLNMIAWEEVRRGSQTIDKDLGLDQRNRRKKDLYTLVLQI